MRASEKKRKTQKHKRTTRKARSLIAAEAIVHSEEDAARRLGVSVRTLQRWRIEGKGPSYRKLGRLIGYTDEDLSSFVHSARRTSTSAPAAA